MIIKLGIFERSPDELLQFVRDEWDQRSFDRKDIDKGYLGMQFAPSKEFNEMRKLFDAYKQGYIDALKQKIEGRVEISPREIEDVRTLEKISLNFDYYYNGDHYKASERRLNTGAGSSGQAAWKHIETHAKHAGLLSGADRSYEVRIKATHNPHPYVQ